MQLSITEHARQQWARRFSYLRITMREAVDASVYIGDFKERIYLYKARRILFVVSQGAVVTCFGISKRTPRKLRELAEKKLKE